jgi:signal transduction histidine kinase
MPGNPTGRPAADLPRGARATSDPLFDGPGEMRALCRAFDWSATPLGPVEEWPLSLRTVVGLVLGSRNPMFLFWGPELIQIYNDAYRPSLGSADGALSRHPRALGMRGQDFWTDIWETIGPQIEQVMTTGEATWHEDQHLPIERNGRLEDVWWTYSYGPVHDDAGRINGVLVVCQETTSRVIAELEREELLQALDLERSRLAEVFRQAPSFLAVLRGRDHVFELVNHAYYAIVGHRHILGKPVLEALPEVRDQGFVELLDRVLDTGEPYVGREVAIQLVRTPGAAPEERFINFVYQPLVEAGGTRSGVVAHGHDVTEQVLARRQIERLLAESEHARAESEAANRVKAEFLATMSHELRTPLNAIGGYTDLLRMAVRGPVTAEQREFLDRIQQSQRHLLGLINEVLNFAKLEKGAVHYDIAEIAVGSVLAAAEAIVKPQAADKGLELVVRHPTVPMVVRADPDKLRQILVNLLSNAVKFTDPGGRIEMSADTAEAGVHIVVSDTGIGIPPDKLSEIFDPFVQVRSDLKRPYEGTGLGLAISRDLARGMGGDLHAESRLGEGSSFTLTLPAGAAEGNPAASASPRD